MASSESISINRNHVIRSFKRMVNNQTAYKLILIWGEEGIGKTFIINELYKYCKESNIRVVSLDLEPRLIGTDQVQFRIMKKIRDALEDAQIIKAENYSGLVNDIWGIRRGEFRNLICSYFDLKELIIWCNDKSIQHEDFNNTKSQFVDELISHLCNNFLLSDFIDYLNQERSNIDWLEFKYFIPEEILKLKKIGDLLDIILSLTNFFSEKSSIEKATMLFCQALANHIDTNLIILIDNFDLENERFDYYLWFREELLEILVKTDTFFFVMASNKKFKTFDGRVNEKWLETHELPKFDSSDIKTILDFHGLNLTHEEQYRLLTETNGLPRDVIIRVNDILINKGERSQNRKSLQHNLGIFDEIIYDLLESSNKETRLAFLASSVPHKFNESILASILDKEPIKVNDLFRRIIKYEETLLSSNQDGCFYYKKEEIRALFLATLKQEPSTYELFHQRAATHFFKELISLLNKKNTLTRFTDKNTINDLLDNFYYLILDDPLCVELCCEACYHIMGHNKTIGFDQLEKLYLFFEEYEDNNAGNTILSYLRDYLVDLSEEQALLIQYYDARLRKHAGDWDGSLKSLEELYEKEKSSNLSFKICMTLGEISYSLQNLQDARKYYEVALDFSKQIVVDDSILIDLMNHLGEVCQKIFDLQQAEGYHKNALDLSSRTESSLPLDKAKSLTYLAKLYWRQRSWKEAIKSCNEALIIYEELDYQPGKVEVINVLGIIHHMKGEWDDAMDYYNKSLALLHEDGSSPNYLLSEVYILSNIIELLLRQGKWLKVEGLIKRYIQTSDKIHDPRMIARGFWLEGMLHEGRGEWIKAIMSYNSALKKYSGFTDPVHIGEIHISMSNVYSKQGKWERALDHLNSASLYWGKLTRV